MRRTRRTWLLRGVAVAVVAVLGGAWGAGLAGFGDAPSPVAKVSDPAPSDDGPTPHIYRSLVVERAKARRTHRTTAAEDALDPSSPGTSEPPATDAPSTPPPSSSAPTPGPTGPSDPSDPSNPPSSSAPPPSSSPSPTPDDCDDVVDCMLDPITGQP